MRFHVLSDVHTEFGAVFVPAPPSDVVILAGDIGIRRSGLTWAQQQFGGRIVAYIAGNHEYYGESLPNRIQGLRSDAQKLGVRFLENEVLVLGDVVLLGCTLWTDFALHGNVGQAALAAEEHVTDYRRVRFNSAGRYRKLRARDTARLHAESLAWLRDEIPRHARKRIVVVTHHAPSLRSVPDRFREDPMSATFASSLDEFVVSSRVRLWIHGHTHDSFDYFIGETRVLCNPGGYPGVEPNTGFVPGLVVEV